MPGPDLLLLGIDGGATRCCARLSNGQGDTLAEAEAGPANLALDGVQARKSLAAVVAQALQRAGLTAADLRHCHAGLGLAGAGDAQPRAQLVADLPPFAAAHIATDAHIAWLGAHGGADGAVVVLGTGAVGYGVQDGQRHVLGGWGLQISDEGSAAVIGREALRRSIWAWDGRSTMTALAENILGMYGGHPAMVAAMARTAPPATFAAFAPLVFQFAADGDAMATGILTAAAADVGLMLRRFQDLGFARIALMGGVAAAMQEWLPAALAARLSPPQGDALAGALHLARWGQAAP